ncbi:MAG: hypothetical protein APR54_07760 [Candidatus Cloacimonas sp. SDB]|nr:MAG: hypothetical protein APR54_07760 [Candidatus Cloacimonas sp. SDB]
MSYFSDMQVVEWWHMPFLSFDQDIPDQFSATMIGWLGDKVSSKGELPHSILEKLEWAYDHRLFDQGFLGCHECEICCNYSDRGEILIEDNQNMYVAPRMILHYIKEHRYLPPEVFVNALNHLIIDQLDKKADL